MGKKGRKKNHNKVRHPSGKKPNIVLDGGPFPSGNSRPLGRSTPYGVVQETVILCTVGVP